MAIRIPSGSGTTFSGGSVTSLSLTQTVGAELCVHTAAGWGLSSPVGAWSMSGSTITRTASGANLTITNSGAPTAGVTYKVVWTAATLTAGNFTISLGGATGTAQSTAGTYTEYLTATATTAIVITASAAGAGTITAVSVKPITSTLSTDTGPLVVTSPGSLRFFPASGFGSLFTGGSVTAPGIAFIEDNDATGTGFYRYGTNAIGVTANGVARASFLESWSVLVNPVIISTNIAGNGAWLYADAADVLGLRNGATAQELRIYNTWTSSTNYEAIRAYWNTNIASLTVDKGSGGGTARQFRVGTAGDATVLMHVNGSDRWTFGASGNSYSLYPNATNSYDLGSTSNTVRTGYFGTSISTPLITSTGDVSINAPAASVLRFGVAGGTNNMVLNTSGHLTPGTNNLQDQGSAAGTWRTGYFGTSRQGGGTKTLVDATATAFVKIAVASGSAVGARILYTVKVTQTSGSEQQIENGTVHVSAINKGGTITFSTPVVTNTTALVTSGTLAATAFTLTDNTDNTFSVKANSDTSLTPATFTIQYFVDMPETATVTQL